MHRGITYRYIVAVLAGILLLLPTTSFAASIYIESAAGPVSVGDTVVLRVYADTDAASANAVDGTIALAPAPSAFTIQAITLAGSVLTLWPHEPSVSQSGKSISFTGGVPGGFSGTHQLLFSVAVTPKVAGTISFTPASASLYLNDGKGTAVHLSPKPFSFTVVPPQAGVTPRNEWQAVVSGDTTPPEPFTIAKAQDPSVYDNKKYIYFQTTDAQSGIDHYEVKEGDAAPVVSGTTYVLNDQAGPVSVTVYAYDKAGNVRVSTYTQGNKSPGVLSLPVLGILVVLLCIYIVWRLKRHS